MLFFKSSKMANFYDVVNSSRCLAKFYGFFPITIHATNHVKTTTLDIFILFFWTIYYGYTLVDQFFTPYNSEAFTTRIHLVGLTISDCVSSITQAVLPWTHFHRRETIMKIFHTLHFVDQQVN